jgi:hypothetical protein
VRRAESRDLAFRCSEWFTTRTEVRY